MPYPLLTLTSLQQSSCRNIFHRWHRLPASILPPHLSDKLFQKLSALSSRNYIYESTVQAIRSAVEDRLSCHTTKQGKQRFSMVSYAIVKDGQHAVDTLAAPTGHRNPDLGVEASSGPKSLQSIKELGWDAEGADAGTQYNGRLEEADHTLRSAHIIKVHGQDMA